MGVLGDVDPTAPAWAAGITTGIGLLVGFAYAAVKVVDLWKTKRREWRKADQADDATEGKALTERQREVRLDFAHEAEAAIDRLTAQVEAHDGKMQAAFEAHAAAIKAIEAREREREREWAVERSRHAAVLAAIQAKYAALMAILRMVVAWVQGQKNPMPGVTDILRSLDADDGTHTGVK